MARNIGVNADISFNKNIRAVTIQDPSIPIVAEASYSPPIDDSNNNQPVSILKRGAHHREQPRREIDGIRYDVDNR